MKNVRKASARSAGVLEEHELDGNLVDSVSTADERFSRILKRLSAG